MDFATEYNLDPPSTRLMPSARPVEAYIKSQAQDGWRAIPTRYDDGAFSGASLERPALQQLLVMFALVGSILCWFTRSTA